MRGVAFAVEFAWAYSSAGGVDTYSVSGPRAHQPSEKPSVSAASVRYVVLRIFMGCSASSGRLDRKSTRLNSSHVAISYAVFCLKKKTSGEEYHAGEGSAKQGLVHA